MAAPAKSTPRDAQVMAAILKDMGVLEYEPRVINQMLEFAYRYVTDILDDAKIYSSHANKKQIDADDVKLAVQCRMDHSFTTPPPRDLLMEIARHKNSQALPLIKPYTGPRIPPDRYCLSAPNYRLKTVKKSRIQIGLPHRISGSSFQQSVKTGPTVNISSNNPTLTVVTKGVTIPTVTFVSKPSSASTPSLPKPTFRISSGTPSSQSMSQQLSSIGSIASAPGSSLPGTPSISSILGGQTGLSGSIGSQGISSLQNVISSSQGINSSLQNINSSQGLIPSLQSAMNTPPSIPPAMTVASLLSSNPLKRKLEDDDYDVM